MVSKLPSEKAIKLLDYRGEKELARSLRRCWLELEVHDRGSFVNDFVATVQVHAPLEEYELLRNLPSLKQQTLLKIFKELYSPDDLEIVDIDCVFELGDQTQDQLVAAIEEQKSLMISVATGERRIQDANEEYKKRRGEIGKMLQTKSINDPNLFFDLWSWYKRFKSGDLPTYASRRQFMSELYDPLLARLQQDGSSTPGMFDEPTCWAKVDRTVTEIRQRLEQATTDKQWAPCAGRRSYRWRRPYSTPLSTRRWTASKRVPLISSG
jgi:hypothetical protein